MKKHREEVSQKREEKRREEKRREEQRRAEKNCESLQPKV